MIPKILGPIDVGSSFMIASIQSGEPNVLLYEKPNYYWSPVVDTTDRNVQSFNYNTGDSADSILIYDTTNGGGVGFLSNGTTITKNSSPSPIKFSQSLVQPWLPPSLVLSALVYKLSNAKTGKTARIATSSDATSFIDADNIILVPAIWYVLCKGQSSPVTTNTTLESINSWFCLVDPDYSILCPQFAKSAPGGWTSLSDCQSGFVYEYCPAGSSCGTKNCKGPCSEVYYDCDYESNTLSCKFNGSKFVKDDKWWESPYFIGGIVGFIALTIAIGILWGVLSQRESEKARKKETPSR